MEIEGSGERPPVAATPATARQPRGEGAYVNRSSDVASTGTSGDQENKAVPNGPPAEAARSTRAAVPQFDEQLDDMLQSVVEEEVRRIAELFFKMEDRPDIRARVMDQRTGILDAVSIELQEWRDAESEKRATQSESSFARPQVLDNVFRFIYGLAAIIAFVFGITSIIRRFFSVNWLPAPLLFGSSHLTMALVYLIASFILLGVLGALLPDSATNKNDRVIPTRALLRRAIKAEVTSVASAVANSLLEELRTGFTLSTQSAPQLVELNTVDTIESEVVKGCAQFIRTHDTSAIGISGPRGAGKTTIMRYLCSREKQSDYIGVYVPSPVAYSPADLIRRIHRQVAKDILLAYQASERPAASRRFTTRYMRLLIAAALSLAGGGIVLLGRANSTLKLLPTDILGGTLAGMGLVAYTLFLVALLSRRGGQHLPTDNLIRLCQDELDKLDWSSTTQTSSKNAFQFSWLSMEDQDQIELTEREKTHPERVMDFHAFTARVLEMSSGRSVGSRGLIIALDELDKLSKAEDALGTINGIKDLLHGTGTHFLVSLSEDALATFALRGVPVRDAFDSSFDTIIPVARFNVPNSEALLARRVIGFPRLLSLYCHALSGGLPRDLIRVARQCVDQRRQVGHDLSTDEVVLELTRSQAVSLIDGAIASRRGKQAESGDSLLPLSWQLTNAERGDVIAILNRAIGFDRVVGERLDSSLAESYLLPVLSVMSVAGTYFSMPRTRDSWLKDLENGIPQSVAERLANCKADLTIDQNFAIAKLAELRSVLGMS